ncbi:phage tail tape measure protein [Peribacillus sp. JNUCC41]|uniref:phage tail tape measure protein n=1 Tax=Peribacillus sp. JNUCC41 TaxID=2778370 RepID=UPI0017834456|nr:phage tail tape measure protein [Brevibacillus sp. JNUCC-41]QOS90217.1 phage tail tape measure protein [Brevibacillus sp. JNUCC-41]
MIGNQPLGKMIIEMDLSSTNFTKSLTAVNRSIKSAEREMKANMAVLNNADDKYGALGKQVAGLNKIMSLNEKRIQQLNEKRKNELKTNAESSKVIQDLNKEINTAVQRQSAWQKQVKDATSKMVDYTSSTKELESELAKLKKKTDDHVESQKKSGLAFSAQKDKLKGLSDQAKIHQQIVDIQQKKVADLTREFGEHDRRVDEAKNKYKSLVDEQQKLNASFNTLNRKISTVHPSIGKLADDIGKAESKLRGLSDRAMTTGSTINETGRSISSSFSGMTLAGGLGLGYTIKQAADFEQAMADIKALMSPQEWKQYGKQMNGLVNQLGLETKYSNKEVAIGMQELIKAGVDLDAIMSGGLKSALSLATAGELELGQAAEIASTVLNSFRDDNIDMAKAADLLAGSANASATSVEEMNYSLSQVSSVAGPVGFSFADTNTALAVFAQAGLKGSDAGTSLKTMIMRLSPQTDAAATMMDELGIATTNTTAGYKYLVEKGIQPASRTIPDLDKAFKELAKQELGSGASKAKLRKEYNRLQKTSGYLSSSFFDEQGNVKAMSEVFEILQDSTKNLSKEQKINAFNTIFGSDAIRGAMIASKSGAEAFDEMGVSINKISADDVAKTKMDTLKGSIEKMKGEAESAATTFGTALIPTIKTVAGTIEDVVGWFNKLDQGTQHSIAKWTAIGVGVAGVGAVLGFLTIGIGGLVTGVGKITLGGAGLLKFLSNGVINLGSFTSMTKGSAQSLNAETVALNTNTTALQRNNSVRGGGLAGGKKAPAGTTIAPTVSTGSRVAKNAGKVGKGAKALKYVKGAGPIGTVIGVGALGYELATGSGTKESIGGGIGGTLGGIGGGAAMGAALGSVVPGIGTAIGGIAGGIIGGIVGDKVGSSIGKVFDKRDQKEKALKKAGKDAEKGASLNLKIKGVSASTQKALGEYDKLYTGAKTKLNQIMLSNTLINKKIKDDTTKQYNSMANSVLSSLKDRHQEERVEAVKALKSNKDLSQKDKDDALKKLAERHKAEIDKVTGDNKRVKQIMSNASKEKRALTRDEKREINQINDRMYNTKIKNTTKSEDEITAINKRRSKQRHDITTKEMNQTIKAAEKEFKETKENAEKKRKRKVDNARVQYEKLGVISKSEFEKIRDNAKKEKKETVDQAKKKRDGVVENATLQKDASVKASKKQKEINIENAQKETSGVGKAWDGLTGFIKDTVSWVKRVFGNKDKTSSPPKFKPGSIPENAKGTFQGPFKGGLSFVGEEGPELGYLPGKGLGLVGTTGTELVNLPRGSAILPHNKTKAILSSYNFPTNSIPGFAKGTGDDDSFMDYIINGSNKVLNGIGTLGGKAVDAFDIITKGPSKLWNQLKESLNYKDTFPTFANQWAGGKGVVSWAKNKAVDYFGSLFDGFGGVDNAAPVGSGVERWRGTVIKALGMNGLPTSANYVNAWLRQIKSESGGNEKAIQSTAVKDVNYYSGQLARGLVQVIPPTFRSFAFPGHTNQMNGLDSLLAGMNYAKSRYGANMLKYIGHGHGYENGGIITKEHLAMVGEGNKPEAIIPLSPNKRSRALELLAAVSSKIFGDPTKTSNNDNNLIFSLLKKQDTQIELLQQQIGLLSKILLKDNNTYLDGKELYNATKKQQNKEDTLFKLAKGL